MKREYLIRRTSCDDWDAKATDYLARTVHEEYELIDTGVIDANGDKIMARQRMNPIGFVRFDGLK